jgi:hypothetical protein
VGPFGPYDGFNLSKDWFAEDYICINVAPVAPMIENHLTGKCWETFMKAPEIQKTIKGLRENNNKEIN